MMQIPVSLADPNDDTLACSHLEAYYAPLSARSGYTGGRFDTFDPSGTRATSTETFTSDDLLSLSLLSTPIEGRAAHRVLVDERERFDGLLASVGPDRDLGAEPSVEEAAFAPAWALWRALDEVPGLGPTRVSKLMARKRPRLFPIIDDVLRRTVFVGTVDHWSELWTALRSESGPLRHERLLQVREAAGLDESVPAIRIFDVCAWMDGEG